MIARQAGIFIQQSTCPECRGAGETVSDTVPPAGAKGASRRPAGSRSGPAGVDTGNRLRSSGNGDAGVRGGAAGDLYVFLHVRDHDVFERDGRDLHCEVPLPFSTAALGGELQVPTLHGKTSIKIPAGTQGGTVFRVRGQGVKDLSGARKGDLHVRVQVEVPTKLNSQQQEKLRAFAPKRSDIRTRRWSNRSSRRRRGFSTCDLPWRVSICHGNAGGRTQP